MKYGIITYTSAQNWGGMLQAYALYNYMLKNNANCELINYRRFDNRWFKPRKQLKDMIFSVLMYTQNKRRVHNYELFRKKYLKLDDSEIFTSEDELRTLNNKYDGFITGSDQLWNCETKICYDFYLRFANDNKLLLSYAPSFGQDQIPEKFKDDVAALLRRYDLKSVRENSGKRIVKELISEDIPVVCDPTFLLSADDWDKIANKEIRESNYIFIYTTQVSKKVIKLVKAYKRLNPGVRIISPYAIPGVSAEVKKDIGPSEFLSYIKNAEYVIGTSFHAVVFSLIYKRSFCVVPHSSTGARVKDLLKLLGLERHIYKEDVVFDFPQLDINSYWSALNEHISYSQEYLTQMLHAKKS